MNIILIGFMGAGKSSVARVLSKKLKIDFIELDDLVLKMSGRTSISEIFTIDGEPKFRQLEIEAAGSLQNSKNTIISTGGGIVQNRSNSAVLTFKKTGKVIYLQTSFSEIEKRLGDDNSRPLFKNKEKARQLYDNRKKLYEEFADYVINTDSKNVEALAEEIINVVK